jgi:hypothetical protein
MWVEILLSSTITVVLAVVLGTPRGFVGRIRIEISTGSTNVMFGICHGFSAGSFWF